MKNRKTLQLNIIANLFRAKQAAVRGSRVSLLLLGAKQATVCGSRVFRQLLGAKLAPVCGSCISFQLHKACLTWAVTTQALGSDLYLIYKLAADTTLPCSVTFMKLIFLMGLIPTQDLVKHVFSVNGQSCPIGHVTCTWNYYWQLNW